MRETGAQSGLTVGRYEFNGSSETRSPYTQEVAELRRRVNRLEHLVARLLSNQSNKTNPLHAYPVVTHDR